MMKLAILGGSFNPVHVGHLALGRLAIERFGYDIVSFVPACNPPHKNLAFGATNEDRCNMLSLAIADNPGFKLETCEIKRKGISYTIDTVMYLQDKYKSDLEGNIGLIIGEDLVEGFHLWKDVHTLVKQTDVLLAFRKSATAPQSFNFPFNVRLMENALLDVSSQEIRQNIALGKDWENFVCKDVFSYIKKKNLYAKND